MTEPAPTTPVTVTRLEDASTRHAAPFVDPRRIWLARGLAVAADALQLAAFPVTVEGAFSPISDGLDLVMAVVLSLLVGWHLAFIPSFIVKVLPVADLAPTWTLAVLLATRGGGKATVPVGQLLEGLPLPGLLGSSQQPVVTDVPIGRGWYDTLRKPRWTPTPATISRIWTVLYPLLLGVNVFVFVQAWRGKLPFRVAEPFAINLAANLAFTPILFVLRSLWLATLDVLVVVATAAWAMIVVWRFYPLVSVAFVPYLLWVGLAAVLQVMITMANRDDRGLVP